MGFNNKALILFIYLIISQISCTKLVEIPEPINTITSSQTFGASDNATSAVMAIYSKMSTKDLQFSNGGTTIYTAESSDELTNFHASQDQFVTNSLQASNTIPYSIFWQPAYLDIYMANAVIEGLQASKEVIDKNQLIGEAKFLRAFCYFYLTNIYGDVPLALSTDFNQTALLKRTPQSDVYKQIIADLQDAQDLLMSDYSLSGGERIRANKWAATALLARVYLYNRNWTGADSASTAVINSGNYSLTDLGTVFLKNNNEAILQLQTISTARYYGTYEGVNFIPSSAISNPKYFLTPQLLNAFEVGDKRRVSWLDSSLINSSYYYYPYKYKVRIGTPDNITEYFSLLRLGEQYLIRAEARANEDNNKLSDAINDLNAIRTRAELAPLPASLTQTEVLTAVAQERRIELFAEWGHRWLDLKRWGTAVSTLDTIPVKVAHINANQLLYPIPLSEIQVDPNLKQNVGY